MIFNPSLLFLPVFAGEISLYHVFLFVTLFWPLDGEQCCTFYTRGRQPMAREPYVALLMAAYGLQAYLPRGQGGRLPSHEKIRAKRPKFGQHF